MSDFFYFLHNLPFILLYSVHILFIVYAAIEVNKKYSNARDIVRNLLLIKKFEKTEELRVRTLF